MTKAHGFFIVAAWVRQDTACWVRSPCPAIVTNIFFNSRPQQRRNYQRRYKIRFFEDDLPKYLSRNEIAEIVGEMQLNSPEFTLRPHGLQKLERDEEDERSSKKPQTEKKDDDEDGM